MSALAPSPFFFFLLFFGALFVPPSRYSTHRWFTVVAAALSSTLRDACRAADRSDWSSRWEEKNRRSINSFFHPHSLEPIAVTVHCAELHCDCTTHPPLALFTLLVRPVRPPPSVRRPPAAAAMSWADTLQAYNAAHPPPHAQTTRDDTQQHAFKGERNDTGRKCSAVRRGRLRGAGPIGQLADPFVTAAAALRGAAARSVCDRSLHGQRRKC